MHNWIIHTPNVPSSVLALSVFVSRILLACSRRPVQLWRRPLANQNAKMSIVCVVTVPRFSHRWTFPKMRTHVFFHEVESMVSVLGALAFHVCRRMKMILLVGVTDSRISFRCFSMFLIFLSPQVRWGNTLFVHTCGVVWETYLTWIVLQRFRAAIWFEQMLFADRQPSNVWKTPSCPDGVFLFWNCMRCRGQTESSRGERCCNCSVPCHCHCFRGLYFSRVDPDKMW